MGPIYGVMKAGRDWLVNRGVDSTKASYLITKQYLGGVQEAGLDSNNPNRLDDLIAEQTAGGHNAQALDNLDKLGGLEAQQKIMDKILERIRGDSDGFI
jgi:pyrroline-5-carboxylate reductase